MLALVPSAEETAKYCLLLCPKCTTWLSLNDKTLLWYQLAWISYTRQLHSDNHETQSVSAPDSRNHKPIRKSLWITICHLLKHTISYKIIKYHNRWLSFLTSFMQTIPLLVKTKVVSKQCKTLTRCMGNSNKRFIHVKLFFCVFPCHMKRYYLWSRSFVF